MMVMFVCLQQCSKCHEQKPAAEFHRDCNKPDGLRGRCRACEAQAGQVRRQSRHKTLEPTVESKVCRRCNIEKSGAASALIDACSSLRTPYDSGTLQLGDVCLLLCQEGLPV